MRRDVRSIRSLLISLLGEDREGVYRPAFVREILAASTEQPTKKFRGVRSFLDELTSV